jgi:hypothetical protein
MDICGLYKGRACVYIGRASAGHIYLCKFLARKSNSQAIMQGALVWKTRIPTTSDSCKKLRKKVIKPILKYPKSIPRKPYRSPQYGLPILFWVRNPPTDYH